MNPVWRIFWPAMGTILLIALLTWLMTAPAVAQDSILPRGMTQTEFFSLVGFVLLVIGAISGAWWRIEGKIKEAKESAYYKADQAKDIAVGAEAKATFAHEQLKNYQVEVAEKYVSKAGHRESTEQIMGALNGVKSAIDGTNQRIDRLFDERPRKQS